MTRLLASGDPLDHVYQWVYVKAGEGMTGFTVLSNHVIMQFVAVVILLVLIPRFVRLRDTGDRVADLTPRGFGNFIDSICVYFRNQVAKPILGDEYTDRFIPFIWSAFFYVLTVNLLGLVPLEPLTRWISRGAFGVGHGIGGTATGNIFVTGTLACVTLLMIIVNGLRLGRMEFIKHFCPGPLWLAPLLVVVELVGLVARIFALCVRLFANMVAGHVLLSVLAGFVATTYHALGAAAAGGVGVLVVLTSVAFNFLEILVAFLQAFIFTFLTTLFIGQAIVFHHNGHEHEEATH